MIFEDRHIRGEGKTQDETKEIKMNDTLFLCLFFKGTVIIMSQIEQKHF